MASNEKKRLEAIADHLALQASQEPQDEFIMDLVSTPEGIVDISTVYLYRRHNPTTLQKNLHLNQKGVMNQLLASIWLMNDLRLIWIQSVSMCS